MDINQILDELKDEHDQLGNSIAALENLARRKETRKILDDFKNEKEYVERAVVALDDLARSRGKRRGRRPLWITAIKEG